MTDEYVKVMLNMGTSMAVVCRLQEELVGELLQNGQMREAEYVRNALTVVLRMAEKYYVGCQREHDEQQQEGAERPEGEQDGLSRKLIFDGSDDD